VIQQFTTVRSGQSLCMERWSRVKALCQQTWPERSQLTGPQWKAGGELQQ